MVLLGLGANLSAEPLGGGFGDAFVAALEDRHPGLSGRSAQIDRPAERGIFPFVARPPAISIQLSAIPAHDESLGRSC